MKRAKPEHSAVAPISLSGRRYSIQQQKLLQPYKMELGSNNQQHMDHTNNKNFFNNMKAELSNIKTDFEKLVRKQSANEMGLRQKDDHKKGSTNALKAKCMSANKNQDKRIAIDRNLETDKYEIIMSHRNFEDKIDKLLNLEKNMAYMPLDAKNSGSKDWHKNQGKNYTPLELGEFGDVQYFQTPLKGPKEPFITENKIERNQKKERQREKQRQRTSKQKQSQKLKSQITKIHEEMLVYKKDYQMINIAFAKTNQENKMLKDELLQFQKQFAEMNDEILHYKNREVELHAQLQKIRQIRLKHNANLEQFNKERDFYKEQINQISIDNNQLANINMEIGQENDYLKENVNRLESLIQDIKQMSINTENDMKKQMAYLKKDLQQYEKREEMYTREILRLEVQLREKNQQLFNLNQSYSGILTASTRQEDSSEDSSAAKIHLLKMEIVKLQEHLAHQIQKNKAIREKYHQEMSNFKIQDFSKQFQSKTNILLDENTKLKNINNFLQASIQTLHQQNKSYSRQISLYEARQNQSNRKAQLSSTQWEQLTEKIESLQEQNRNLKDKAELRQLIYQVSTQQKKENSLMNHCSILQLDSKQLKEIEDLRHNIKTLKSQVQLLEIKLGEMKQIQNRLLEQVDLLTGSETAPEALAAKQKWVALNHRLSCKTKQVFSLKHLLFRVIVQKVGKREDEQQVSYLLRTFSQLLQNQFQ